MDNNYILTLKNITKEFPGVKALDDVTINIERGTIHGLVGENGAGKSTLIKVLAGIYQPNKGEIILDGKPCRFNSPIEARRAGISVVHQEIKLAEPLSVAENMFLGNVQLKNGLVDWKGMRRRAREIVEDLGMDIDINAQVSSLTVAKKQIVEIMHAINNNSRILIMDEPSAVLTDRELEVMFRIVKQLRDEGITIIYISHRLDEIFGLCSNVSVLRDGCHIDTIPVASVDRQGLINMMVGREMGQEYPKEVGNVGGTILEVKNLSLAKLLTQAVPIANMPDSISFLGRGYIFGGVFPVCVLLMIIVYAIAQFVTSKTRVGRNLYAVGGSREAAFFSGINVKAYQFGTFLLGSVLATFGGLVLMSRLNSVAVTNGQNYEFDAVIGSIIGGVSLAGGKGRVIGTMFGCIFLNTLFNGFSQMGVDPFVQDVLKGVVLVLAVTLDVASNKKKS